MKQAELLAAFNAGKIVVVGKFLHFKAETIAYRDRVSGKPATFDKIEFTVMTANGVVFVQPDTRRIPGFDIAKYKPPFAENAKVVVEIQSMVVEKGVTTIGGTIEALD